MNAHNYLLSLKSKGKTEHSDEVSHLKTLKRIKKAIHAHTGPVRVVLCNSGFEKTTYPSLSVPYCPKPIQVNARTYPSWSKWLLVIFSFWKEMICFSHTAPVAGESGWM